MGDRRLHFAFLCAANLQVSISYLHLSICVFFSAKHALIAFYTVLQLYLNKPTAKA
jgi:hypothetical protein